LRESQNSQEAFGLLFETISKERKVYSLVTFDCQQGRQNGRKFN
jgi:hypothetical protein